MSDQDETAARRAQTDRAGRLMDLLGLSEDELCQTLDADALTLISGQLDHDQTLQILSDLLAEAQERTSPAALRSWMRATGQSGRRPVEMLTGRDFAAFEDALDELARDGFVVRRGRHS